MTPLTKRYSYWWDKSPNDLVLQSQLPNRVDIVIVGAGFAAISTAYWILRLAKSQKLKIPSVLVVDDAPYAGFKSTGRMTGSIYLGSNVPAHKLGRTLGENNLRSLHHYGAVNNALLKELVQRGVQCDAHFSGGLRIASTIKELSELSNSAERLRGWGYSPVELSASEVQFLMIAPKARGGLFIPGEGMFDPFAFTTKLARILTRAGIRTAYSANICHISPDTLAPRVIMNNGHIITASHIVHTNPELAPPLGGVDVADLILSRREHVIRTHELSPDLDDTPLPHMPIEFTRGLDSARLCNRSLMMVGGKAALKTDPDEGILNDSSYNDKILRQLDKSRVTNLPVTHMMTSSHAWTYIESEGADGLPIMGEYPGGSAHSINVAHGRNKFGLAFLGAKNIAEEILGIAPMSEFEIFSPARFVD